MTNTHIHGVCPRFVSIPFQKRDIATRVMRDRQIKVRVANKVSPAEVDRFGSARTDGLRRRRKAARSVTRKDEHVTVCWREDDGIQMCICVHIGGEEPDLTVVRWRGQACR